MGVNVPVIDEQKQEDRFHVKHFINNELSMESNQIIVPSTGQCPLKRVANRVLTLLVNGIPTLKLNNLSELPEQTGSESWALIDHDGLTLASYFPVPLVNLP